MQAEPDLMEGNLVAWSVWSLLDRQWIVGGFGGLIGWSGYSMALDILSKSFDLKGAESLIELKKLKIIEMTELEIDAKRNAEEKKKRDKGKERNGETAADNQVAGDLDGFETG